MNDMTLFLDLILLASGVYCMYTWLRLAVTKHLFKTACSCRRRKRSPTAPTRPNTSAT